MRYDYNVFEAYRSLDIYNLDNISVDSLRKFFLRNFITPSETDLANIIKRLDVDRDYRIPYVEFKTHFSQGSETVSYNTYVPLESSSSSFCPQHSVLRRPVYDPYIRTRMYCSPRRCYSPLRTFYSPPKKILPYSVLRSDLYKNT